MIRNLLYKKFSVSLVVWRNMEELTLKVPDESATLEPSDAMELGALLMGWGQQETFRRLRDATPEHPSVKRV